MYGLLQPHTTTLHNTCLWYPWLVEVSPGQFLTRTKGQHTCHMGSVSPGIHTCPWCLWSWSLQVPGRFWLLPIPFFIIREGQTHSAWVLILSSSSEQPDGSRREGNTLEASPEDSLSHMPVVLIWACCHNSSPRRLARAPPHRAQVLLPPCQLLWETRSVCSSEPESQLNSLCLRLRGICWADSAFFLLQYHQMCQHSRD